MKVGSKKKNILNVNWKKEQKGILGKGIKRYTKHSHMSIFRILMKQPWSLELGGNHYLGFNLLL